MTGVFDRASTTYGTDYSNFFDYFAKKLVEFAQIPPKAHVLDVATGRGALLKNIQAERVVGIDISPNMIEQTSQDFPRLELICADAENLPFPDNSFDSVLCGFAVFFFPNIYQALREFHRVLKPGGQLTLSTWGKDDICDLIFHEVYSQFTNPEKTLLHSFENPDYISEILSSTHFTQVSTVSDTLTYVYPTIDDWFDAIWSHAGRAKLEKLNPFQLTQIKHELSL